MKTFKKIISFSIITFLMVACTDEKKYEVGNYMKEEEKNERLFSFLPYIAKLENGVTYNNRFDPKHKAYFEEQLRIYKFSFERYFVAPDSTHYFLIWKVAPSLYEKKIAIGGRYKIDALGKFYEVEELFNTPKMKLDELKEKSFMLFDYMVKNKNVDKFYGDYLLVEFPDANCIYDKTKSRWTFKGQERIQDSLNNALRMKDSMIVK